MHFRQLIILLFTFTLSCCSSDNETKTHKTKKHLGIYLDRGVRTGFTYLDQKGNTYNYRTVTTTITNDSIIPINLKIAFSKKYYYTDTLNGKTFRIFILPEAITGEKQYNENSKLLKSFLDTQLDNPITVYEIINPKQEFEISIGVLCDKFDPGQVALISKVLKPHFSAHDSLINQAISNSDPLSLWFCFDWFQSKQILNNCYSVIPCGQISYTKQ